MPDGTVLRTGWAVLLAVLLVCGCATGRQNVQLGAAAAVALGAQSPSNELEQIYYLGIFDPEDQVPQMMYRVTIRAQASAFNQMRYGSGWVPSWVVDSLNSSINAGLDTANEGVDYLKGVPGDTRAQLEVGRRLVMFGPDGFREAPKDQRLVIVMGASPEKFFQGVDDALGAVAGQQLELDLVPVQKDVLQTMVDHGDWQLVRSRIAAKESASATATEGEE